MLTIRTNLECPSCGVEPFRVLTVQAALLIHGGYGGYGANRQTEVEVCWCGLRVVAVTETNPRIHKPNLDGC